MHWWTAACWIAMDSNDSQCARASIQSEHVHIIITNIVNNKGSFTEHHFCWNFAEVQVHPQIISLEDVKFVESTLLPVFMSRITFVGILSL